ncbi:hypothetical protein ACYOEI_29380 [Singulisphaera rosea]
MIEESSEAPMPAEMRAFNEANRATWQAVRMREASRALVTGHLALFVCLSGTTLVVTHRLGTNAPFVAAGLLFGYLGCLFWALRRIRGPRLKSLVKVTDRGDELILKVAANPLKAALYIFGIMTWQALCRIAWPISYEHMSKTSILASLAIFPLMGIGYFVHRVVRYAFWEDCLFAMCIALAYMPIFLPPGPVTGLSFLSLAFVIVGTASLYHRWEVWSGSLGESASERTGEEVAS